MTLSSLPGDAYMRLDDSMRLMEEDDDGTQDATMDRIYVQDDLLHKLELVKQLEERRG